MVVSDLGLALLKRRNSVASISPSPMSENLPTITEDMQVLANGGVPKSPMSGSHFDILWRQRLSRRIVLPPSAAARRRTKKKHPIVSTPFCVS